MSLIESIDTQLLLFVNGLHCDFLDPIMFTLTNKWFWVPFYVMLTAYVIHKKRSMSALWCILSVVLAVTLSDQIGAGSLREMVGRLRPTNPENPISPLVHVVNNYRSGAYGFPSCHAANSFALAMFLWLYFRNRLVCYILFPWALLQCYTRAYLGVHYPGDLMAGALLGCTSAGLVYYTPRLIGRYMATRVEIYDNLVRRGFFGNLTPN